MLLLSVLAVSSYAVCVEEAKESKSEETKVTKKIGIPAKVAVVKFEGIADFANPEKSESFEFRDKMATLSAELTKRAEKVQKLQTTFQKKLEEAQRLNKTDDDTTAELMKLKSELKIDGEAFQKWQQSTLGKFQAEFSEKMSAAVEKIAKEQGWTVVIPGPVLYSAPECDITADVVKKLNSDYRAEQRAEKFKGETKKTTAEKVKAESQKITTEN